MRPSIRCTSTPRGEDRRVFTSITPAPTTAGSSDLLFRTGRLPTDRVVVEWDVGRAVGG